MPKSKKPRKRLRRNTRVSIPRNPRTSGEFQLVRSVDITAGANLQGSVAAFSVGGYDFLLSDLPNYTEFTALFDRYKFRKVVVHFIPMNQEVIATAAAVTTGPVFVVKDYDDKDTTAYTENTLLQYANCEVHKAGTYFTWSIVPRPNTAMFVAGAATGVGVGSPNTWIDCASPGVNHYGMKWGVLQATTLNPYRLIALYHLSFKDPR